MDNSDIRVIIAAYNEEEHIQELVRGVVKQGYPVIVVDDGSSDNTKEEALKGGATVLRHIINMGKGAAVKTGCDFALREGAEVLVLMDADGQHRPEDIPRLLRALKGVDIVISYRKMNKNMPFVMLFGNLVINTISSIINGINVKDTQSGSRAMTALTYRKVRWKATDYGMESEMIANISKKRLRYRQIPISTIYNDSFKGTTIFDGIRIVFRLLKWRLL